MSEVGPNKFGTTSEVGDPSLQESIDALGLKELIAVLDEMKADEEQALEVIERVLLEPIPDPDDQEAVDEYNAKMRTVSDWSQRQLGRANALAELQEKITERHNQSNQAIDK